MTPTNQGSSCEHDSRHTLAGPLIAITLKREGEKRKCLIPCLATLCCLAMKLAVHPHRIGPRCLGNRDSYLHLHPEWGKWESSKPKRTVLYKTNVRKINVGTSISSYPGLHFRNTFNQLLMHFYSSNAGDWIIRNYYINARRMRNVLILTTKTLHLYISNNDSTPHTYSNLSKNPVR